MAANYRPVYKAGTISGSDVVQVTDAIGEIAQAKTNNGPVKSTFSKRQILSVAAHPVHLDICLVLWLNL